MTSNEFTIHPVAQLFPAMSASEFAKLKADIAANGLRQMVTVWRDQIIDGRHRYKALVELGKWSLSCAEELDDDADPVAYAISTNLTRRHLTESQRAMVAAELANMKKGRPNEENAPIGAFSQDEAAEMLGVSRRSIQRATETRKKATPELANAVKEGAVSVSAAADLADAIPDKAEQAAIVAKGAKAVQQEAKKARERKKATKQKATPNPKVEQDDPPKNPRPMPKAESLPSHFAAVVALWKQIEDAMAEADKGERLRIRFWLSDRMDDLSSKSGDND